MLSEQDGTARQRVLHVEDNDLDAEHIQRVFARLGDPVEFVRARDGIEGLEILRASGSVWPRPIVLLDLNMPRMNGIEFLVELRSDSRLRDVVVTILTTSDRDSDIEKARKYGVCAYLVKPLDIDTLHGMAEALADIWQSCNTCAKGHKTFSKCEKLEVYKR